MTHVLFACGSDRAVTTAQDVFICREAAGRLGKDALLLEPGELGSGGTDDAPRNIVLHRENVLELRVVGFRPEVPASFGIRQFNIDANAIARPADTASEEIARIEHAPDLGRCDVPTLELIARRFGRNQQVREAAERPDHILGDPVTKVILAGIARQVLERQYPH